MVPAERHLAPKRIILILGILALAFVGGQACVPAAYVSYPDDGYVSDYEYLADYGEWIEMPAYGLAWSPYVVEDWAPFYHGHWSWTDDGWAWISYEPFGWLVYHYGYWNFDRSIGWFWMPGTTWSPARVEWYTFGDYCGWAPLPPPDVYWPDPWDDHDLNVWIVVDVNDFPDENIGRHRIKEMPRRHLTGRDVIIKRPPTVEYVQTVTKRTLPTVKIERQRSDVRPEVIKNPQTTRRTRDVIIKEMVLPEPDRSRVEERTAEVEREVLTPKKSEPTEKKEPSEVKIIRDKRDTQKDQKTQQEQKTQQKQRAQEKKAEDTPKQKTKRR